MKLFELYEQPVLTGTNNLTSIANAVKTKTGATIRLGAETTSLGFSLHEKFNEESFFFYRRKFQHRRQFHLIIDVQFLAR